MAAHHARSNSFPSRQHPLIPEFDEQLCRLRSSELTSSSSTSVACKVSGLQDLHDCVDKLLLLPLNQQALSKHHNQKSVDALLDGSLRLLDVCNIIKDALLQMKESTQQLGSIMRRRRGEETTEFKKFLASRKVVKKAFNKAMENRHSSFSRLGKDKQNDDIVSMLREIESVTVAAFESLVSFTHGPKSQSRSLVSKLMHPKRVACVQVNESNEFAMVDAALNLLITPRVKISGNNLEENAQKQLQTLELCIQDLEGGVESLYRRLIKTRVSLLNILNH